MTYEINSQNAIDETLDGETIIINLKAGNYYSLNPSGTAIWTAIKNKEPISSNQKEVKEFLEFLIAENLISAATDSDTREAAEKVDVPSFSSHKS